MSSSQIRRKNKRKRLQWLFFCVGLILGLSLSILIFFIDRNTETHNIAIHSQEYTQPITQTITDTVVIVQTKTIVQTEPQISTELSGEDEILSNIDFSNFDSIFFDNNDYSIFSEDSDDMENVEFSIEIPQTEESIAFDKIINNRRITVQNRSCNGETPATVFSQYAYFEVQQWSTPIKNSISYQRNSNFLKVKGMDISQVEIFFIEGDYFLFYNTRFYRIPNNTHFDRIVSYPL